MDKVTMESWLKVYHNDSLLIKTLGMFDLKEQTALMLVCQRFQYIIRDVIWKKKYSDLFVQWGYGKYVIGWNKPAEELPASYNRRVIDEVDLYEFLEYFSHHLNTLTVRAIDSEEIFYEGVVFNFPGNFENLEVLKYNEVCLKDENIKTISEKCKRLKELHLKEIGSNTTGKYLDRLNNLETFCIELNKGTMSYEWRINIFKLPLKYLKLCVTLEETNFIYDTRSLAETLVVLKINHYFSDNEYDFDILGDSSVPFERLQELEFLSSSNVENYHFDLVAEKCLNLQRFSITDNSFDGEILKFPPNLKELHIDECSILTPKNAWYILTELNLSALTLSEIDSRKMYKFNYGIDLCRSLKTLKLNPYVSRKYYHKEFWIDVLENCSSDSFQQVESLTLCGSDITDSHMELITCKMPMVQHLNISNYFFDEDHLFTGNYIHHLKNLKLLRLYKCESIEFWHLIKILQTSRQLESLTLLYLEIQNVDSEDNARLPSIESCRLTKLYIDSDNFLICQSFWLNLLRLNLLKIKIFIDNAVFTHKFDWEFLVVAFQDKDIAKNIDLVIEGTIRNRTLKTCRWFVEMLYEPPINRHLDRVLVNDHHIAHSLKKSEFYDRIMLCLNAEYSDFAIVFN